MQVMMTTNASSVAEKLAATKARIAPALAGALRELEPIVVRAMQVQLSGGTLRSRTGRLARSVRSKLKIAASGKSEGQVSSLEVSAGHPGQIHRKGAYITPKKAQMLAIPVGAALSGRLSALRARTFIGRPGIIGFVRAVTTPKAILGVREDGTMEVVFARKSSVRLAKQDYVPPTIAAVRPAVRERIDAAIAGALASLSESGTGVVIGASE